jgi:hypothetical protein
VFKMILPLVFALSALPMSGAFADEVTCSAQCWILDTNANYARQVSSPTSWGDPNTAFASLRTQCPSPYLLMNVTGAQMTSSESETWVPGGWYGSRLVLQSSSGVSLSLAIATEATSCLPVTPGQAGQGTDAPIWD